MNSGTEPKRCPKCGSPIPVEAPQGLCPKCLFQQASIATETGKRGQPKTAPPTRAELAAAFPQLEIFEIIGQGGMGFVFKARQPKISQGRTGARIFFVVCEQVGLLQCSAIFLVQK